MSISEEKNEKLANLLKPYRMVEGTLVPKVFEDWSKRPFEKHVQLLKAMELHDDDVFILAFVKSGTHWIWEIVSMLLSGKAEYEKRVKEFNMIEAAEFEKLQSQPSPRVFNSHLPLWLLPRQIKEKRVKVIHVYRNIKDVIVSCYFHLRQVASMKDITLDWVERSRLLVDEPGSNYFQYLKHFDDFRKSHPDVPFFNMSFEDTKENPVKAIQGLAEFLGVEASPQLVKDIAEATSFSGMKQADKTKEQYGDKRSEMYRRGEVGDWKNHMTVAQSERIDAAMTHLESSDYHLRFTL